MGLAPYGEPKYKDLILKELIDVKEDGSFRINMEYFNFAVGLTMTNEKFHKLFGGPPRKAESKLTQKEMDLARSIQDVTEDIVLKLGKHVYKETGMKYLTLAGGVALNCVANGKLLREGPFEDIWIQPAASDAGGALGAALTGWYSYFEKPRNLDGSFSQNSRFQDSMKGSYLGPEFSDDEILEFLNREEINYERIDKEKVPKVVSALIAEEKVIGWFQGRMEFGPRALGARSIIADARSPKMQKQMNLKIKFRESFRPFAPSVLAEKVSEYFEIDKPSPYMLLVAHVKGSRCKATEEKEKKLTGIDKLNIIRSDIPAVTHVDYSARIQTVHEKTNKLYYNLLKVFEDDYKSAVIINTSFNVRGEPIVCTPEEAYICFMRTNIDYLVLGNFLLDKSKQKEHKLADSKEWQKEFELD